MGSKILICSLLLFCALTTIHSYPNETLYTTNELENTEFGRTFPRHGRMLLHWFANNIDMDSNIMTLHFEPSREDYGFHRYCNKEGLLPSLVNSTDRYYTVGHLNKETVNNNRNNNNHSNAKALPAYVTESFDNCHDSEDNNRDRIILRVSMVSNQNRLGQVYITQLYPHNSGRGSAYDPQNTYSINPNLLRQMRNFTTFPRRIPCAIQKVSGRYQISICRNPCHPYNRLPRAVNDKKKCSYESMKLEVKASEQGTAMISWSNIPKPFLDSGVYVLLFKDNDSKIVLLHTEVHDPSGTISTTEPLNPSLQVRLHKRETDRNGRHPGEEIWRGHEFDDANNEKPVYMKDYDASLVLFVENGKACARLYIKKTFTNWMDEFHSSWVGFYLDGNTGTSEYVRWQWAIHLEIGHSDIADYDVYVYRTDMAMSPGINVRFILWRRYGEKARTASWEIQNPAKEKVEMKGYDASLQIYTEEGYACTRLYIKKSFTDWKDTFECSWVGFYSDEHKGTSEYYNWQWVKSFSKENKSDIWDYDTYLYRSNMAMSPGVQARFMLLNSGDEKARTLPWEIQRLANSNYTVDIKGYDARLQLYVKNGKACARLYIRESFTNWKKEFDKSWVGLYADENTFEYDFHKWVVYFSKESNTGIQNYDSYVFESSMTMHPGVQARFMLHKSGDEKARTLPWKD
uniref:Uncharacterized protein n=1 Tax=Hucho hucho TaxID=62062 RepID=A0A4W5M5I5_9TELE